VAHPCGAVAAERHQQGRILCHDGLNLSSFRYWLRKSCSAPDDIPLVPPAIVPLPFTLAPKAPSIGLLVGKRYALDIPADPAAVRAGALMLRMPAAKVHLAPGTTEDMLTLMPQHVDKSLLPSLPKPKPRKK